jgi:hypothetical protein
MLQSNPRYRHTLLEVINDKWVNIGYDVIPIDYEEDKTRSNKPVITESWVKEVMEHKVCDAGRFMMTELKSRMPEPISEDMNDIVTDQGDLSSVEVDMVVMENDRIEPDLKTKEILDNGKPVKQKAGFRNILRAFTKMVIKKVVKITGGHKNNNKDQKPNEVVKNDIHYKSQRPATTRLHNRKVATAGAYVTETTTVEDDKTAMVENEKNVSTEGHFRTHTESHSCNFAKDVFVDHSKKSSYHSRGRKTFLKYLGNIH